MKKIVSFIIFITLIMSAASCAEKPAETAAEITKAGTTEKETVTETETETETEAETETETETETKTETEAETEPVNEVHELLRSGKELKYTAKQKFLIQAETVDGTYYKQLQGGCTDGEYMYFAMNDTKSENSYTLIYKVKIGEKKAEKVSGPLQLDHANDITYNEKLGTLIVVHNAPNKKKLSYVDKETLTVTKTAELSFKTFCLQYCAERDQYVCGKAGGQNFYILDADLNPVNFIEAESTGYTTQGVDCDGEYIYFVQYNNNVVVIYDWDGNRVACIDLPITGCEPENIFHSGEDFYVSCAQAGIKLYQITLKEKA